VTSSDGVQGSFGSAKLWGSAELALMDGSNKVLASPSALAGGSAFSTTWQSAT
jgi:hypothetical protein